MCVCKNKRESEVLCSDVDVLCLDNTRLLPTLDLLLLAGTLEERGLSKHSSKEELSKGPADDHFEEGLEVYDIPYVQKYMEKSRITKVCRIFPGGSSTSSSTSSDTTRDEEERLGCLKDGDTAGLHSTNM